MEWRTVKDFPRYEVSESGQIRSYNNNRHGVSSTPKLLNPTLTKGDKYLFLNLCDGTGKRRKVRVHRLVCETFHGPSPDNKPHALHRDDNHLNNHSSNLYWGDFSDNTQDKLKNGRWNNQHTV